MVVFAAFIGATLATAAIAGTVGYLASQEPPAPNVPTIEQFIDVTTKNISETILTSNQATRQSFEVSQTFRMDCGEMYKNALLAYKQIVAANPDSPLLPFLRQSIEDVAECSVSNVTMTQEFDIQSTVEALSNISVSNKQSITNDISQSIKKSAGDALAETFSRILAQPAEITLSQQVEALSTNVIQTIAGEFQTLESMFSSLQSLSLEGGGSLTGIQMTSATKLVSNLLAKNTTCVENIQTIYNTLTQETTMTTPRSFASQLIFTFTGILAAGLVLVIAWGFTKQYLKESAKDIFGG